MIEQLNDNHILKFAGIIGSIIGAIVGILAIIPKIRKIIFTRRQRVNIKEQKTQGDDNKQSGGNIISKEASASYTNYKNKVTVNKQIIIGNRNKQAGGDIIE